MYDGCFLECHTVSSFCRYFSLQNFPREIHMDLVTLLGLEELPGDWQLIYQDNNWIPPALRRMEQMSPTGDTCGRAYPWHCSVLTWGQRYLTGKNKTKRVISLMLVRTMKLRKTRNRSESSFLSLLIKCNSSKRKSPLWAGAGTP